LLSHQNNYIESLYLDAAKNFNILAVSSNVLHNYFGQQTKLFSNLYLAKFLDSSAKLFFPCRN